MNARFQSSGVNLGGWLILEPFITPSLFDQFAGQPRQAIDEWSFSDILGRSEATKQLLKHWDTFVTEADIAALAASGLNAVRIPVGYWMWQNDATLPFISGGQQLPFLKRVLGWVAKYKMKAHIDLHGAKGSQNGWNHSGKAGIQGWDNDENVEHTLSIIRSICDTLLTDPTLVPTISAIELLNEPYGPTLRTLQSYYLRANQIVRTYSNTVKLILHDGFYGAQAWGQTGFYSTATREQLPLITDDFLHANQSHNLYNVFPDTHIYHIFVQGDLYISLQGRIDLACGNDRQTLLNMKSLMGIEPESGVCVNEWSIVNTDCTKHLNGYGQGARFDGTYPGSQKVGDCTGDNGGDYTQWSSEYKAFLLQFGQAQMDGYEAGAGWMFWNFKTESSAPQWNYLLGIQQGWIPKNVLNRSFKCPS